MLVRPTRARARPFARRGRERELWIGSMTDRGGALTLAAAVRRNLPVSPQGILSYIGIPKSERLGLATLCETLEYGSRKQVRDQAGRIERLRGYPPRAFQRYSRRGRAMRARALASDIWHKATSGRRASRHDVMNTGESHMAFIEIEIKGWRLLMWLCSGLGWRARS